MTDIKQILGNDPIALSYETHHPKAIVVHHVLGDVVTYQMDGRSLKVTRNGETFAHALPLSADPSAVYDQLRERLIKVEAKAYSKAEVDLAMWKTGAVVGAVMLALNVSLVHFLPMVRTSGQPTLASLEAQMQALSQIQQQLGLPATAPTTAPNPTASKPASPTFAAVPVKPEAPAVSLDLNKINDILPKLDQDALPSGEDYLIEDKAAPEKPAEPEAEVAPVTKEVSKETTAVEPSLDTQSSENEAADADVVAAFEEVERLFAENKRIPDDLKQRLPVTSHDMVTQYNSMLDVMNAASANKTQKPQTLIKDVPHEDSFIKKGAPIQLPIPGGGTVDSAEGLKSFGLNFE